MPPPLSKKTCILCIYKYVYIYIYTYIYSPSIKVTRLALAGTVVSAPDHEPTELDTILRIWKIMDSKRRSFSLGVELVDLMVPGNSRPSHLDDVHIISRNIELWKRLNEFGDQVLLGPAEVGALTHRAEIIWSRSPPSIYDAIVLGARAGPFQRRLEKMVDRPFVHAILIQAWTLQMCCSY